MNISKYNTIKEYIYTQYCIKFNQFVFYNKNLNEIDKI